MNKLFLVSFVYAPFQVAISIFSVWAKDDEEAEMFAKLYKSEGEEDKDWSEYVIETTELDASTRKQFQTFDPDEGWVGNRDNPVELVFYWSRG